MKFNLLLTLLAVTRAEEPAAQPRSVMTVLCNKDTNADCAQLAYDSHCAQAFYLNSDGGKVLVPSIEDDAKDGLGVPPKTKGVCIPKDKCNKEETFTFGLDSVKIFYACGGTDKNDKPAVVGVVSSACSLNNNCRANLKCLTVSVIPKYQYF